MSPRRPVLGHTPRRRALGGKWRPDHVRSRSERAACGTLSRLMPATTAYDPTAGRGANSRSNDGAEGGSRTHNLLFTIRLRSRPLSSPENHCVLRRCAGWPLFVSLRPYRYGDGSVSGGITIALTMYLWERPDSKSVSWSRQLPPVRSRGAPTIELGALTPLEPSVSGRP